MSVTIDTIYCKGCEICIITCKAQALGQGNERNAKGYLPPVVNQEACINCGTCEVVCPEMAITVEKEEK